MKVKVSGLKANASLAKQEIRIIVSKERFLSMCVCVCVCYSIESSSCMLLLCSFHQVISIQRRICIWRWDFFFYFFFLFFFLLFFILLCFSSFGYCCCCCILQLLLPVVLFFLCLFERRFVATCKTQVRQLMGVSCRVNCKVASWYSGDIFYSIVKRSNKDACIVSSWI